MQQKRQGPAVAPGTVLVAEDHIDSRDALRTLLEAFDYAVLLASTGREAVDVARARRPDLILMDIMMPELDGFEAIRLLRQDSGTRNIPIIAVTAMDGARQLSLAAGADDFVPKPIDTQGLLRKIRGLLPPSGHGGGSGGSANGFRARSGRPRHPGNLDGWSDFGHGAWAR